MPLQVRFHRKDRHTPYDPMIAILVFKRLILPLF